MNKHGVDLTEGSIISHTIKFSLPLLAGNALHVLYNTVDSFWVGRFLGKEALAAVSVSFPVIFLLISLVMGFTMGTSILVSQYAGAKDFLMVKKTISTGVILTGGGSLILSIVGVWASEPLLLAINTPTSILPLAASYLSIFLGGLIFLFGFNLFMAVFRGLGDANTPLKYLTVSTLLNLILDPVFIFVFHLNVAGAALATVISQGVAFALCIWRLNNSRHLLSLKLKELRLDRELAGVTFKLGFPSSIQQTMVSFGMLVLSALVNGYGANVVAAFGAGSRIDSFALMPAMSLNIAVSSIVGQNIGAGKFQRVRESVKYGVLITVAITLPILLVIATFPELLLKMFIVETSVLREGISYLRIESVSYLFFGIMFVYNGALRGAGDALAPMVITLVSLWGIRLPLSWYLAVKAGWGPVGIWWGITIGLFISMFLSWAYFQRGGWREKAIVKQS